MSLPSLTLSLRRSSPAPPKLHRRLLLLPRPPTCVTSLSFLRQPKSHARPLTVSVLIQAAVPTPVMAAKPAGGPVDLGSFWWGNQTY